MAITQSPQSAAKSPPPRPPRGATGLRESFSEKRRELAKLLTVPGAGGITLAHRHAELADETVRSLFVAASRGRGPDEAPVLLGAVGGYGRRLLGLASDLDLCFVTTGEHDTVAELVEAFIYPLWDAGISVGHQIINLANVATDADNELALATELLDFRPLAGNTALVQAMQARLSESVFSEDRILGFIGQLEERTAARHEQFGDSVYLLEPDVKNGTGGLRDLDSALWAARIRFGTGDLDKLHARGILTPAHHRRTARALDFLWTVRNHLHHNAGRKADRLTFGEQEVVASALGYCGADRPGITRLERTGQMVEAFMSDYYRHARELAHTSVRIIGHAQRRPRHSVPPIVEVGDGLVECEGRLGLAAPERLADDPVLALRVYGAAVNRNMPLLARTRDAIAAAATDPEFCRRMRTNLEAGRLFTQLACISATAPFRSGSILAELHDVGLVLAMIPEFAPVVGRVHHDLYHVYTVDVHSIAAVDQLRALTRGDLASRLPLAGRLAAEVTRPQVLFLATLLHDVGKAIGGHGHAERGAQMADEILTRLGLSEDEIDDACHLILHHLTMYMMAVRRDLSDPTTIAEFVRDVRGREGLRELYLLTVADVSTTSAVAMTKWKRSMLDGLYRASDSYLSGEASTLPDRVSRVKDRARTLWTDAATAEAFDEYLRTMPARYFLSNQPDEIIAHAQLAISPARRAVGLSLVPSKHDEVMGLCVVTAGEAGTELRVVTAGEAGTALRVVTGDRPGLLASITAAISANRFTIQAAQVNSRALASGDHQAVDLFWVKANPGGQSMEDRVAKLERDLSEVLSGKVSAASLVTTRGRPSWSVRPTPAVFTEVVFDHHGSRQYTIIEVLTEDRPALLFTLASALHNLGISIAVAKISTEGKRAVDVFYATELDGTKVDPGARSDEIASGLVAAVATASESDEAAE